MVAVAVCPDQTLVAVARGNGSISLWCTAAWTCVLVRLALSLDASRSGIARLCSDMNAGCR